MRPLLALAFLTLAGALPVLASVPRENVVVVANTNDPDSMTIARYYIEQRQIPETNLVALPFPNAETITGETYVQEILNPLREALIAQKWINAQFTGETDKIGRRRLQARGHRIGFLVLCRLPYQISGYSDEHRDAYPAIEQAGSGETNAAVDSELALLMIDETPVGGVVGNPLYGQADPAPQQLAAVMRVARLDGPSVASVKRMIDSAITGEREGLRGRAYVDKGGPHPQGEQWLDICARDFETWRFPTSIDENEARFLWTHRFDAPALYIGWWVHRPDGAVEDRAYRFPPGAIAIHISSFSGQNLRNPKSRWSGVLVDRGIAATVGNVYEPYLGLTHHPHLFFRLLQSGLSTGEAAAASMPATSWNAIFIGDPLYEPFKVRLDQQIAKLDANDPWSQYVLLRKAEQIGDEQDDDAAFAYLIKHQARGPGMALDFAIAQGLERRARRGEAIERLKPIANQRRFSPEEAGLAYQVADLLIQMQARDPALAIMKTLIAGAKSRSAKLAYMQSATPIAMQLGETDLAARWQKQIDNIERNRAQK